jgi:hypothetical protein
LAIKYHQSNQSHAKFHGKPSQYTSLQHIQDAHQATDAVDFYQPSNHHQQHQQGTLHVAAAAAGSFEDDPSSSQGSDASRWVCYSALECEEDLEYSSSYAVALDHQMEEAEEARGYGAKDRSPHSAKARLYQATVSIYTEQNSSCALAHANAIMSSIRLPGKNAY